jgi:ketosteroid isomerase-like protein
MSEQAVRVVEQVQALLASDNIVADLDDDEQTPVFRAEMTPLVEPEFEVTMVATPTAGGARVERRGIEGFRESWIDWTEAFETYRIEIEDMIEAGDRVVTLVRQGGVTKTGGVEMETEAAAVWTVRDNRVSAVEFHLDRESALRSAGLDP